MDRMVVRGVFAAVALILVSAILTVSGPAVAATSVRAGVGPSVPQPPVVIPAAPAPDPAPAACAWLVKGYSSNCDGLDPDQLYTNAAWPLACTDNNDLLMRTVSSTRMPDGSLIQVTYSGGTDAGCRTVAASLYAPSYAGSGLCDVTLTRSSDMATSTSRVLWHGGFWSAETQSFYDADVSSYATATCTHGGHTYTGRTSGYTRTPAAPGVISSCSGSMVIKPRIP